MILMKTAGLTLDPYSNSPIVILKDESGEKVVPIWIGPMEAHAIAAELEGFKPPRPMTHDLLRNVLNTLEAKVQKVEITELKDNTFYAVIHVELNGETYLIDSRPSDAIALSLRTKSEIFVHPDVVEAAAPKDKDKLLDAEGEDRWKEILESLSEDAFGKYKQ